MKILILGGSGQVGSDLLRRYQAGGEAVCAPTRQELDVAQPDAVRRVLDREQPDVVINCTVFHPVDECERQPERSLAVNALAPFQLALACHERGCKFVHFSSDYVFDGESGRPYRETDCPRPRTVLGVSKVAGEQLIANAASRHFIIRTSGLYGVAGSRVKGGNFVETMLRLGREKGVVSVVNDLRMAQTYTGDLAAQTLALIRTDAYGLYHASNHGDLSWFEFAELIFRAAGMTVEVKPVSHTAFPALAPRPRYSVLENNRLRELGLDRMRTIPEALAIYLRERSGAAGAVSRG